MVPQTRIDNEGSKVKSYGSTTTTMSLKWDLQLPVLKVRLMLSVLPRQKRDYSQKRSLILKPIEQGQLWVILSRLKL